ncbi:MAG TPA: DUF445 domain-containing protein [Gemmatimonadales bacterium]|nr:DUF445 domain-containing protein [Gemmatimonadales bacterium]
MTTLEPRAVPIPQVADAEAKQLQLDRMKRRASGLLVAMSAVFLVTLVLEPQYPWLGYVRATAEAAMVGGLADWFAITALFRHPLNIPIPHTAIIPNRKDRIGRTLGNFVQHNFLSPQVLGARLLALQPSRRAAEWLRRPEHARSLARHAASALRSATDVVRDEDVHALLERSVIDPLRRRSIAPVLAKGLVLLTADHRHQQLLDRVIQGLAGLIMENENFIRSRIHEESPWWVPGFVDDRVHARVIAGIQHTLLEISADPGHPLRRQFDDLLTDWIVRLQESPDVIARADAVKQQLFDNPTSRGLSASLWTEVKRVLDHQAEPAPTDAPGAVERGLIALADGALEDEALMAKLDGWIVDAVLRVVEQHRHEVGALIEHTVRTWDPGETSRRLELAVGRDLQFVRINGTLVGGLVGLILYTASRLAGYGGH